MPISQTRMIALIRAGRDFEQALQTAETLTQRYSAEAADPHQPLSAEQALGMLSTLVSRVGLCSNYTESLVTLAVEERHFTTNASRNDAAARWQARQRSGQGAKPRARPRANIDSWDTQVIQQTTSPTRLQPQVTSRKTLLEQAQSTPYVDPSLASDDEAGLETPPGWRDDDGLPDASKPFTPDTSNPTPDHPGITPAIQAALDREVEQGVRYSIELLKRLPATSEPASHAPDGQGTGDADETS